MKLDTPLLSSSFSTILIKQLPNHTDIINRYLLAVEHIISYYEKIYKIMNGQVDSFYKLFDMRKNIVVANIAVNVDEFSKNQLCQYQNSLALMTESDISFSTLCYAEKYRIKYMLYCRHELIERVQQSEKSGCEHARQLLSKLNRMNEMLMAVEEAHEIMPVRNDPKKSVIKPFS